MSFSVSRKSTLVFSVYLLFWKLLTVKITFNKKDTNNYKEGKVLIEVPYFSCMNKISSGVGT